MVGAYGNFAMAFMRHCRSDRTHVFTFHYLVSATLVETPKHGTFLLDTGEGTYGQMFRQFGGYKLSADQTNSVDDRIKGLKGIFISHLHADHHLGIVTLIDRWNQVTKKKNVQDENTHLCSTTFVISNFDIFCPTTVSSERLTQIHCT